MRLEATILGCGSSAGVPRVAGGWGACDPANPKNRRRRCSLLVERINADDARTTVLVDTSPDLRAQLLDAEVSWIDGVIITHDHADHIHGIDDLRPVVIHNRRRIAVHMEPRTAERVMARFGYCFKSAPGSIYPPILEACDFAPPKPVPISGAAGTVFAQPIPQQHGPDTALGFRFGDVAYSADLSGIPDESLELLSGLDVWIVDALRYAPHVSHFNVDQALEWIERLKPRRAVLTNMHVDLDYEELKRRLPDNVEPAYDGMRIVIAGGG